MPLDRQHTFLRWAGGKRRIVPRLIHFLPFGYESGTYFEPFLGAASMFIALAPRRARLSDLNKDLINAFWHVRESPDLVFRYLSQHRTRDCHQYFYRLRDQYNSVGPSSCAQAARFIYLNRTCFNGIFRVNRKGQFNVPYGFPAETAEKKPVFPDREHLRHVSGLLKTAVLGTESYQAALHPAGPGDFVYLDPPYPPLNGTSFFRHYTADRFQNEDQEQLAEVFSDLNKRGCLVLLSNADTPLIRRLYGQFQQTPLPVTRYVSSKKVKHAVSELVIANYDDSHAHREGRGG